MKILFVVHQFFPSFYTGVERHTLNLAAQLRRMGHTTTVLSVSPPDPALGADRIDYEYQGLQVVACKPARAVRPLHDYSCDPDAETLIERLLDEVNPNVVHVMHPRYLPETRTVAARKGLPVFVHLHDYWFICPRIMLTRLDGTLCRGAQGGANCESLCGLATGVGTRRMKWARQELALADGVISPSRFLREVFTSQDFDTHDWHWIPYGVDYGNLTASTPGTRPHAARRRMLKVRFLGTLLPHKGPHILVEAMRKAPRAAIEVILHGSEFHEVRYGKRLRKRAKGDHRITFAGSYDHSDLSAILSDTDLAVVPSLWYENFPIAAQTAIAAGVPVVASDLGGMREMVECYKAGFLFPPGDSSSLASLLQKLAHHPTRLDDVCHQMQPPPSLEEEAHRIEMIYRCVLG